jgi:hypothetical protein
MSQWQGFLYLNHWPVRSMKLEAVWCDTDEAEPNRESNRHIITTSLFEAVSCHSHQARYRNAILEARLSRIVTAQPHPLTNLVGLDWRCNVPRVLCT